MAADGKAHRRDADGVLPRRAARERPLLLLHVGRGKTGTSTLQQFLAHNRDALERRRWRYPPPADVIPGRVDGEQSGNAAWLARCLESGDGALRDGAEQALRSTFAAAREDRRDVLLSSEILYRIEPDDLGWVRAVADDEGFDSTLLCFIREQADYLVSAYAQQVKKRQQKAPMQAFFDKVIASDPMSVPRHHLNYDAVLSAGETVFGRERVIARVYERSAMAGGDIRRELLGIMRLREEQFDFDIADTNVSASASLLELLWRLNVVDPAGTVRRSALMRTFGDIEADGPRPAALDLVEPDTVAAIRAIFADGNEAVRRRYFPDRERLFKMRHGSGERAAGGIDGAGLAAVIRYFTASAA